MGCCCSKPIHGANSSPNARFARAPAQLSPAQQREAQRQTARVEAALAGQRAREEKKANWAAWEDWWQAVFVARRDRARRYVADERQRGRWDHATAKSRCDMGVAGCKCYKGIDFGPFLHGWTPLGTKYGCYAAVERDLARRIGPAPVPLADRR